MKTYRGRQCNYYLMYTHWNGLGIATDVICKLERDNSEIIQWEGSIHMAECNPTDYIDEQES